MLWTLLIHTTQQTSWVYPGVIQISLKPKKTLPIWKQAILGE